jgi:large subunit ribosomal protein L15
MPLQRRLPKLKGFKNRNKEYFALINVDKLAANFEAGDSITPEVLRERGLIKKRGRVKVLGEGDIDQALTVHAHAFSLGAVEKIKAAGGTVETVDK